MGILDANKRHRHISLTFSQHFGYGAAQTAMDVVFFNRDNSTSLSG